MIDRRKWFVIVFGTDTKEGKRFDVILLWFILLSALTVILESVPHISAKYHDLFTVLEWGFTVFFSLEYMLRIYISPKPHRYIFSIWGLIDLLSILPTYMSLIFAGYHYLLIVRIFRLLRVFRVLKLVRFNKEAQALMHALRASSYKISIFLLTMVAIVTLMGTVMYVVEGEKEGFSSIPQSIYWAIVTVTTVGYGDMVPHTVLGKLISSLAMIIGYAIIAVPTGIVTVEMARAEKDTKQCPNCNHPNDEEAKYCNKCGHALKTGGLG